MALKIQLNYGRGQHRPRIHIYEICGEAILEAISKVTEFFCTTKENCNLYKLNVNKLMLCRAQFHRPVEMGPLEAEGRSRLHTIVNTQCKCNSTDFKTITMIIWKMNFLSREWNIGIFACLVITCFIKLYNLNRE